MIRIPWATFSLATIIAIVSIVALDDLDYAFTQFGLIPDQAWRYGGLTIFTSFFIHTGASHLIRNLYFLLTFGMSLENYLGWKRWLFLVLITAVAGNLLHVMVYPLSETTSVGASGGVSGLVAFYALMFPHARIYILFRDYFYLRWLQFPAWSVFMFCTLLQFWRLYEQVTGRSNVLATAHLGGTAAGVLLWMMWKKTELQPAPITVT